MYSVILVDDRIDVIEGISAVIDWPALGCELVGWAQNGRNAMQLIEQHNPNIVITDIKMPVMDGLQLIEAVKEQSPGTRFIILSGYEDFSYTQKAIRLGVDEYLLKPTGVQELTEVIVKLAGKLDKDASLHKQIHSAQKQLMLSLPPLRDSYFHRLVSMGSPPSLQSVEEQFAFMEISMPLHRLALIAVEMSNQARFRQEYGYNATDSYLFAIANAAHELFAAQFACEAFRYGTDKVAVLIHMGKLGIADLKKICHTLQNAIEQGLKVPLAIGVSQVFDDVTEISGAFEQALEALSYRTYLEKQSVILHGELPPVSPEKRVQYLGVEDGLLQAIRAGQEQELERLVRNFVEVNKNVPPKLLQSAVQDMVPLIRHYLFDSRSGLEWPDHAALEDLPIGTHTTTELRNWLFNQMMYMQKIVAGQMVGQSKLYVEQAKAIIRSKYATALSLSITAELIGLSSAYLSAIFKENEGITFTDYLLGVRIEKACQLLATRKYKVNEVARMVGYTDIRHFSELFKKRKGQNPKEYIGI